MERAAGSAPLDADLTLTGGVLDLPQVGQKLFDVSAHVARGGDRKVELTVSARGGRGLIAGGGHVSFEPWARRCADLACIGHADIPLSMGAIPLAFDGMPVGDASGGVKLEADTSEHRLDLTIKPSLDVALDPFLGRSVQSLDDDPHFTVCYAGKPPAAARRISIKLPMSAVKVSGKILGDRVNIVGATLTGSPKVELDDEGGAHERRGHGDRAR